MTIGKQWIAELMVGLFVMGAINFMPISPLRAENLLSAEISGFNQRQNDFFRQLNNTSVIYLGENHDRLTDHQAQFEIIKNLYYQQPKIAIALEMFSRRDQENIDRYLRNEINEEELVKLTEFRERWGYNWEYYAPVIRFAKQHQLPVIALNSPREVTRKFAREGYDGLTEADKQYIPPIADLDASNLAYRELIFKVYQQHQSTATINSKNFDRFFLTQVLWDETMAEKIAQFYQEKPHYQIVVLVGSGHIIYNYGIPDRVKRRINQPAFKQKTILLSPNQELSDKESQNKPKIADFIWQK